MKPKGIKAMIRNVVLGKKAPKPKGKRGRA